MSQELTTDLGFKIKLSPRSFFLKEKDFNKWNWDLCWLWIEKKELDPILILNSLKDLTIVIIDQELFPIQQKEEDREPKWVLGATYYNTRIIYICSLYFGYSKSQIKELIEIVYKHELSHMIAGFVSKLWYEDDSHSVFNSIGLKNVYEKEKD